jgi:hypothetical protein
MSPQFWEACIAITPGEQQRMHFDIDPGAGGWQYSPGQLLPHRQPIPLEETLCVTVLDCHPPVMPETAISGLDVVPAHLLLSNTEIELATVKHHRQGIRYSHNGTVQKFLQDPMKSKGPSGTEGPSYS